MKILLILGLACWFLGSLLFTLSLAWCARRPVNRRRHTLARWHAVNPILR